MAAIHLLAVNAQAVSENSDLVLAERLYRVNKMKMRRLPGRAETPPGWLTSNRAV
ncbi:MAG: hypothetical protein ACYTBJ_24500 [Planctomycetota bacterium]